MRRCDKVGNLEGFKLTAWNSRVYWLSETAVQSWYTSAKRHGQHSCRYLAGEGTVLCLGTSILHVANLSVSFSLVTISSLLWFRSTDELGTTIC